MGERVAICAAPHVTGGNRPAAYGQNRSGGKILEVQREVPGRIHVVLIREMAAFRHG
jgi:hypothetical protein